jgi:DNA-binding SARP family transcriptional activator/tetratricopeptide (TPR) repeat protein
MTVIPIAALGAAAERTLAMRDVSLLGERAIREDDVILTRSPRALALLGHLVIHAGTGRSRQRMAGLFWPDSADEQALTNLRRELHHLRVALDHDPSLVITARELSWQDSPSCRVDLREFRVGAAEARSAVVRKDSDAVLRHGDHALANYHGDFLPGDDDDWVGQVRAELQDECVALLDLVRDTRADAGDSLGALTSARQRVGMRPLEDIGYRRLMELLADIGDRAGAVSTYHRCASVLERELGIDPDPKTRKLLTTLLQSAEPAVPVTRLPSRTQRSGSASAALVGRGQELSVLAEQWEQTVAGRPGVVVVCGDPGVGKTRLVSELVEAVRRRGAAVASAQCFGTSGQLALAPVADWLRSDDLRGAIRALDPVWQTEVERLVPSGRGQVTPAGGPQTTPWQRHRFFEGLSRALLGADCPLLLVLDNLHWCDAETLALLNFCLGLAGNTPVLLVATARSESEFALSDCLRQIRATAPLTEISLGPLDPDDTAAVAEDISGRAISDADAALLYAATGGFPLYVVEAARSAGAITGPLPFVDFTAVLRTRLDQISPAAQETASLAAAVGRDFHLELLVEASDLDTDTVVCAVDELWRCRILREVGDAYDFSHDLLREAAYRRASPAQRWLFHRRIAQSLELIHVEDVDSVAAQLANQYTQAGRTDKAIEYYARAANIAAGVFAHGEAVRLHQEALQLIRALPASRRQMTQELAALEAMAAPMNAQYSYASPDLRRNLERCIHLAEQLGRRESMLNALVGLWTSQFVQGDMTRAHLTAARAMQLVTWDSPLYGAAHFASGGSAINRGQLALALERLAVAVAHGGSYFLTVGTRTDVHAAAFSAHAHWLFGQDEAAVAVADQAIAIARAGDTPFSLAVALAYAAITHQLREDRERLAELVTELNLLCERFDFTYYREWGLILQGWLTGGADGIAAARRGIASLTAQGAFARMPYWLSLLAELLAVDGADEAARATLDAALSAAAAQEESWWVPELMRRRAVYDTHPDAVHHVQAAADLAAQHGSVTLADRCAADLAALDVPAARSPVPVDPYPPERTRNGTRTLRP